MSRYIQEAIKPEKKPKKEKEREMPKVGKYSVEDLQPEKTTNWSRGSVNG